MHGWSGHDAGYIIKFAELLAAILSASKNMQKGEKDFGTEVASGR
jgi:hypothetical protein